MFEWIIRHVRELQREKSDMFFALVFPIAMVFILGNMLAELDNPDTSIGTIHIAYHYDTETSAVRMFIDALAEHDGVTVSEAANAEEMGDADAMMVFGSPLSISIAEGEDPYKNRAAMLMAQSFSQEYAAYAAVAGRSPEAFAELLAPGLTEFPSLTADKDLGVQRSMMDYYAVTMIVMIAFMGGGVGGAGDTFHARQNGALRRVSASPRGRARLFLESVVGLVPLNIMQTVMIMVPSVLFFGAHYAQAWHDNILLFAFFILLGLAVSSVFMLVGLFIRINPAMPIMAIMWSLLFLSGTFAREMTIEGFSEYLPMNIAQRAVFDLTLFGRYDQLLLAMGGCAVVLAVACAVGSALFRRKEIFS